MIHFLAFVSDRPSDAPDERIASFLRDVEAGNCKWQIARRDASLTVCTRQTTQHPTYRVYELPGKSGVIIGRLFDRAYTAGMRPAEINFDSVAAKHLNDDAARVLVRDYWGHYVAFLHDPSRATTQVLRDPTGGLPCIKVRVSDGHLYASDLNDALPFLNRFPSVDFQYLAGRLAYRAINRRETGLRGIQNVLGGECVTHRNGNTEARLQWDPFRIAHDELTSNRTELVRQFRDTTEACVQAWASDHSRIVLCLSGGLDSAIVLACLQNAPNSPSVICFNQHSRGSDTDERRYARLAAARTSFELIETERPHSFSLDGLEHVPRMPIPFTYCIALNGDYQDVQLARKTGASTIFTGSSGDELFYQGGPLPPAVDFAFGRRHAARLLSIAMDDAYAGRVSLWRVLKLATLYGLMRRPFSMQQYLRTGSRSVVPAEVRESALRDPLLLHPLLGRAPQLPPGKLIHAYGLLLPSVRVHNPYVRDDSALPLSPLFSQPLIELSLRTPLYLLASEGRDRSIARDAFKDVIPREIFLRRTKGGVEESIKGIISHNIHFIRSLLLDGLLVKHGLLDQKLLSEVLSGDPSRVQSYFADLLSYLDCEAWLRSWTASPISASPARVTTDATSPIAHSSIAALALR